jgi:glycosyltransferase involved in cell wall biosynthesis
VKILFTNNYDANAKRAEWIDGRAGAEHLWGLPELQQLGHAVDILPFAAGDVTNVSRWGSAPQQIRIIARGDYDLLYVGAHSVVNALAFMRAFGIYRRPIVAICHHGLPGGRVPALQARGFDRLIFLSREIARRTVQLHPREAEKAVVLNWGFDLQYHRAMPEPGEFLLSAGKTGRDYDTLCLALARYPVPTKIFCSADSLPCAPVPECVAITAGAYEQNAVTDSHLQDFYSQAFAVAIPLQDQPYLLGLTSLLDAMAHAKAVIVSKTPFIDIDVEAEGCGISVAPGDVDGWARAIRFLSEHPAEAQRMGRQGRALCEQCHNAKAFGAALADEIATLLQTRTSRRAVA